MQKSKASNIDLEVIEEAVSDIISKKVIDKDFRIFSKSSKSFALPQISDVDVETLYLEKDTLQKSAHESA